MKTKKNWKDLVFKQSLRRGKYGLSEVPTHTTSKANTSTKPDFNNSYFSKKAEVSAGVSPLFSELLKKANHPVEEAFILGFVKAAANTQK